MIFDKDKEHYLWTEKYRPISLDTYIGNKHITDKVKIYQLYSNMKTLNKYLN